MAIKRKIVKKKNRPKIDKVMRKALTAPPPASSKKEQKQRRYVAQRNISRRLNEGWEIVDESTKLSDLVLMEK